jgi:hypothetical protein
MAAFNLTGQGMKRNAADGLFTKPSYGEVSKMKEEWEEKILCATQCSQCHERLDQRILSVYTIRLSVWSVRRGKRSGPITIRSQKI